MYRPKPKCQKQPISDKVSRYSRVKVFTQILEVYLVIASGELLSQHSFEDDSAASALLERQLASLAAICSSLLR